MPAFSHLKMFFLEIETVFSEVESLKTFIQSLGEALVLYLNRGLEEENFQPPYSQPVQKLFAQYIESRPP